MEERLRRLADVEAATASTRSPSSLSAPMNKSELQLPQPPNTF